MKYLLFDADGTILDFRRTESVALERVFSSLNIPYIPENISKYKEINLKCWRLLEENKMTQKKLSEERFRLFLKEMERSDDPFEVGVLYTSLLSRNGYLIDGARNMLSSLENYKKSLITNGVIETQNRRIDSLDIRRYFERVFISEEIGVNKPDKRFFDCVLKLLKIERKDAVIIGDSIESDIMGGVNSGIDTIYLSFDGKRSEEATYNAKSYEELVDIIKRL